MPKCTGLFHLSNCFEKLLGSVNWSFLLDAFVIVVVEVLFIFQLQFFVREQFFSVIPLQFKLAKKFSVRFLAIEKHPEKLDF